MKKQKILDLKPTQFAVGMLEVDEKIAIAEKYTKAELKKFVNESPVPVVLSAQGEMFIVDHHHFLCVCYHVGVKKVKVIVVKDFSKSKIGYGQFWKWMYKTRNSYPYCQFGEGPRKPLYLPKDIRGLADDPYRSIAWFVRKAGAFENSDRNYAEFQWANFFRSRKLLDTHGPRGMPKALVKAVHLAQNKSAKGLPGYEVLKAKAKTEVVNKIKIKAKEIINKKTS